MRNALPTNSLSRWTGYRDEMRNYVIPFVMSGLFGESGGLFDCRF